MPNKHTKYNNLFNNKLNAMAYCQVVFNKNGKPVNYIFLEVNRTFEKLTGLKKRNIIGKKVTDVIPGFEKSEAGFIEICGNVALTGEEVTSDSLKGKRGLLIIFARISCRCSF